MSQIAQYWLIGVHKERQRTLGYRVASLKHKRFIDLTPEKMKGVLVQQPQDFGNVAIRDGEVVGTQGQLDRYTAIRGYRAEGKQLVILQKVVNRQGETLGFVVIDYRFSFCGFKAVEELIEACVNPLRLRLANASIVEQDGKKFIRAIQGEFNTIVDEKAPYQKPAKIPQKQTEPVRAELRKTVKDGFEYILGAQIGDNGEYENIHPDVVGVRYVGIPKPQDIEEAKTWEEPYALRPLQQINGKQVLGFKNQFSGVKNKLIDFRGFKFEHIKGIKGIFRKAENCWVFIDNIENEEIFTEMFIGTSMTIVTKLDTNIQKMQMAMKLKVVPFRKLQIQGLYDDLVQNRTRGKGFGVVVCCKNQD